MALLHCKNTYIIYCFQSRSNTYLKYLNCSVLAFNPSVHLDVIVNFEFFSVIVTLGETYPAGAGWGGGHLRKLKDEQHVKCHTCSINSDTRFVPI